MKKKVFISGGSSGIGEYVANNLLANCEVYTASRSPSKNPGITYFSCDLRDDQQIIDLTEKLSNLEIDVFVFNAGIGYFGDFGSLTLEQEKEMLQVNLRANMLFVKYLLPKVSTKTQFIFVGSVAGKTLFSGGAGYQASKFGLRGFVGSLRKEIGKRVFLINPKIVETNFHKNSQIIFDEYKKTALDDILAVVRNIIDNKQDQWEIDL
ncbi:MAG: SDR family NAD(P)-dependent oxidoreductase [Candidatus Absconditabacteria bacterium]|nr:SDR family NAD(P)-dependent oxidoreductase [Candidatus Absconditabacteria bacterium]